MSDSAETLLSLHESPQSNNNDVQLNHNHSNSTRSASDGSAVQALLPDINHSLQSVQEQVCKEIRRLILVSFDVLNQNSLNYTGMLRFSARGCISSLDCGRWLSIEILKYFKICESKNGISIN